MGKKTLEDGWQVESLMKETPYVVDAEGDGRVDGFTVDRLSDEELFVLDALSRCGPENVTDEEVVRMLVEAKGDAEGWRGMMDSMRRSYKDAEVRIVAEGNSDECREDVV